MRSKATIAGSTNFSTESLPYLSSFRISRRRAATKRRESMTSASGSDFRTRASTSRCLLYVPTTRFTRRTRRSWLPRRLARSRRTIKRDNYFFLRTIRLHTTLSSPDFSSFFRADFSSFFCPFSRPKKGRKIHDFVLKKDKNSGKRTENSSFFCP